MSAKSLSNLGHNTTAQNATTQEAKEKIVQGAEHVKQEASKAISDVKDTFSNVSANVVDEAKDQAASQWNEAKSQVLDAAEEKKEHLTGRLSSVADVLRQTGQQFRSQEDPSFAHYTEMAADQVEQVAGYLDSRDLGELAHNVQDFARRQPEIFIGGALAAGFFLGRFLKSSQGNQTQRSNYRSNHPRNAAYSSGYAAPHAVDPYSGATGRSAANPAKNGSASSQEIHTDWRAENRATGIREDA
ncbi:MAG: hypothetical protein KF753_23235 [Caldilineaceae bacterium]|nr:hypothetical protein [Caldilineaceae bacterium]